MKSWGVTGNKDPHNVIKPVEAVINLDDNEEGFVPMVKKHRRKGATKDVYGRSILNRRNVNMMVPNLVHVPGGPGQENCGLENNVLVPTGESEDSDTEVVYEDGQNAGNRFGMLEDLGEDLNGNTMEPLVSGIPNFNSQHSNVQPMNSDNLLSSIKETPHLCPGYKGTEEEDSPVKKVQLLQVKMIWEESQT